MSLSSRDAKFLRVHSLQLSVNNSLPPVHIGFGCMPGSYRVQGRVVACDEPEVLACALRKLAAD